MTDYVIMGLIIIVFLFQLITLWYVWWVYTTMVNNVNDCEDMIVDIYTLQVAEAKAAGIEVIAKIPKRVQDRIDKKSKNA